MTDPELTNKHRKILTEFKHSAFSGVVDHDARAEIEGLAQRIDWRIQICWSCGAAGAQQAARIILDKYPE